MQKPPSLAADGGLKLCAVAYLIRLVGIVPYERYTYSDPNKSESNSLVDGLAGHAIAFV
jgi:hypothetical protein